MSTTIDNQGVECTVARSNSGVACTALRPNHVTATIYRRWIETVVPFLVTDTDTLVTETDLNVTDTERPG